MKERRTKGGGVMKGFGMHPESICCFLCSLQSNAIGTGGKKRYGKEDVPFYWFLINFLFIVFLKLEP